MKPEHYIIAGWFLIILCLIGLTGYMFPNKGWGWPLLIVAIMVVSFRYKES